MKISIIIKVVAGFVSLAFGAIGLILPVWPTTPFVLIAIACFSQTPTLKNWLLKVKIFKEYHESYYFGAGLKRITVIKSLSFLWIALTISMILTGKLYIILLLSTIGIGVTIHILYISKPRKKCKLKKTDIEKKN